MEQSIKMDQGMRPSPYYTKCCEMEDLMVEVTVAIHNMQTAGDHMMNECVDNQGQAVTAYSEIAADHMIQKLKLILEAIG